MPCPEQLLLDTTPASGGWSARQCQGCNSLGWLVELAETTRWRGMASGHHHYIHFPLIIHR